MAAPHLVGPRSANASAQTLAEHELRDDKSTAESLFALPPVSTRTKPDSTPSAVAVAESELRPDDTFTVSRSSQVRAGWHAHTGTKEAYRSPGMGPTTPRTRGTGAPDGSGRQVLTHTHTHTPTLPVQFPPMPLLIQDDILPRADISHHLHLRVPLPALLVGHGPGSHVDRRRARHHKRHRASARPLHLPPRLRLRPLFPLPLLRSLGPDACHPAGQYGLHNLHYPVRLLHVSVPDHRLSLPRRPRGER